MGGVAERLHELGLELPKKGPLGSYVAAVRAGDLLFVSGGGPQKADGSRRRNKCRPESKSSVLSPES